MNITIVPNEAREVALDVYTKYGVMLGRDAVAFIKTAVFLLDTKPSTALRLLSEIKDRPWSYLPTSLSSAYPKDELFISSTPLTKDDLMCAGDTAYALHLLAKDEDIYLCEWMTPMWYVVVNVHRALEKLKQADIELVRLCRIQATTMITGILLGSDLPCPITLLPKVSLILKEDVFNINN